MKDIRKGALAETGAEPGQRDLWALLRARDWKALAARDPTRFVADVVLRPSVGPVAGWLVGALIGLVLWLTLVYAPGAIDRAHTIPGANPDDVITVATGYWTIAAVTALALIAGWEPIVLRWMGDNWRAPWMWDGQVSWPRLGVRGTEQLREAWASLALGVLRWLAGLAYRALGWLLWLVYRAPSCVLSIIDYLLARPIAIAAGAALAPPLLRYGVLFAWLLGGAFAAWFLPAPYGLSGAAAGLLAILAVVRRWSWIERDREAFLAARGSDPEIERIGFAEDLRDEALTAIVFLFLLIPLGLRQVDLAYDAFDLVAGAEAPGLFDWIGFFGAELAKSVPFVDWSEVFQVANGSPIRPKTALGAQLVFALRASLDLLLLAALLQAVQIAARLRDQTAAFRAGKLPILDPFAERSVFRGAALSLAPHPHVEVVKQPPIADFPAYEEERLRQIAKGVEPGRAAASTVLLDPVARRGALAVLARQHGGPETADLLADRMTGDGDAEIRRSALTLAVETDPARAVPSLVALLTSEREPALRTTAARELGRLRATGASEALFARLADERDHPEVRAHAGLALVKSADRRAVDPEWWNDARAAALIRLANVVAPEKSGDGAEPANIVFPTAYAVAVFGRSHGADVKAEAIAALFAEPLRPHALRAARSARGELDGMVRIPKGTFPMGSPESEAGRWPTEGPQRFVTIAADFEMGQYPVTFEEYEGFCAATGRETPSDKGWGKGCRPVIDVSWEDAHAYCDWLSGVTGERYRLPSEAEWEYACRGGTTTPFSTGETISTEQANYDGNYTYGSGQKGEYRQQTTPVDLFPSNAFGLHDMHGNVWEWCADPWHETYDNAPLDGSVWLKGGDTDRRVLRGGSWVSGPRILRSAGRSWVTTDDRSDYLGFRVVRTLTP